MTRFVKSLLLAAIVVAMFGSFNPPALLGQQQQQVPTPVGSTVYGDASDAPMFVPQGKEYCWINFERTHLRCLEIQAGPPAKIVRTHVFVNLELVKPGEVPQRRQGQVAGGPRVIVKGKPAYVLTFRIVNDEVTIVQVKEAHENGKVTFRRLGQIEFGTGGPIMYPASESDLSAKAEETWKMAEAMATVDYDVRKSSKDEKIGMNLKTNDPASGAFKFVEAKALERFSEFEWPSRPRSKDEPASPGDRKTNPFKK